MDKNKLNLYGIIFCVALIIAGIGVIASQSHKIEKLEIKNKAYEIKHEEIEKEKETLRRELEKTHQKINLLEKELNNLPTDEEVIYTNPIDYVDVDDEWSKILKPLKWPSDSFSGNRGAIPD
jgi:predicted nuclease with TOPRIM domain